MTVYIHRFLPTPGEIRTNGTVKTCANHLLSPADQPLLGERVANWAPLVILAGKVAAAPPPVYIFGITANARANARDNKRV